MNGIMFLLPIALGLGLMGLGAFFWAARSGQFEDLDGASMRVLIDDEDQSKHEKKGPRNAADPQVSSLGEAG